VACFIVSKWEQTNDIQLSRLSTHARTHARTHTHTHTHTRLTDLYPGLPGWAGTSVCKTSLDFTEARDIEWQWHQLGHMQVCTSLQTDNHASTSPLSFFTGRLPFLPPNQQRQSTEGINLPTILADKLNIWHVDDTASAGPVCSRNSLAPCCCQRHGKTSPERHLWAVCLLYRHIW